MSIVLRSEQRTAVSWGLRTLERFGGVLFADEPGFGKSYQALAVARALEVSPTVIAPRALHPMWRDYLSRFEMDGKLYSYGELLHDNRLSALLHQAPPSLLIVDEAHAFVNPSTARYRALSKLCFGIPLVLLSATPFQNRLEDGLHLLALFSGEARWLLSHPEEREAGLKRLMAQHGLKRHRPQLRPAERFMFSVETDLAPIRTLAESLCLQGEPYGLILHGLLSRRLSSQQAWRSTLAQAKRYLDELEDAWQAGRELNRTLFHQAFSEGQRSFHFILPEANAPSRFPLARLQDARHSVAFAYEEAAAGVGAPDWDWLLSLPRPLVVFSQYRATVNELYYRFRSRARVARWTGSGLTSNYPRPPGPLGGSLDDALLLATDIAAEGIDLRVCRSLVHADLHWNPMQTLQREGRVLRGRSIDAARIYRPSYPEAVLAYWPIERRRQEKLRIAHNYSAPATPKAEDAGDACTSSYIRRQLCAWQAASRSLSLSARLSIFEAASLLPTGASYWLGSDIPQAFLHSSSRTTRLQRVHSHLASALESTPAASVLS